tara:strand:+ start:767 stop:1135 length:369 start_codon:yes stop_codon:yes gene_type:complete
MKWLKVEWQGRTLKIPAQKLQGKIWFHLDGETHVAEVSSERRKGNSTGGNQDGVLTAPMPGKILKIFKSSGEEVCQGDPVLAMEAMKMEYTLEADRDGKLGEMSIQVGDQVALGQVLAKIEE